MVLTVDARRKMAALFAVFVRVDGRNKAAKKSKKKSKLSDQKKARSPTGYAGLLFTMHILIIWAIEP